MISTQIEVAQFLTYAARLGRKLPIAISDGLTETAKAAAKDMTEHLPQVIDRPTPFTKRAVGWQKSRKNTLEARVFIKDKQAEYLSKLEYGGKFQASDFGRSAVSTPINAKLNKYGSMGRGRLSKAVQSGKARVADIRGVAGVWREKKGGGLVLLARLVGEATYDPQLGFRDRVSSFARDRQTGFILREMRKALRG